jgi:NAD(P)-dependent dehydrogenase (short-subunit alcohol dehydrogenase family)
MQEFTDKLVVITGAASGVGRSLAIAMAEAGARVLAADIDDAGLLETKAALDARGAVSYTSKCDVTSQASVDALAARAFDELGGVHLVFANAGIAAGEAGPLWGYAESDWKWTFDVNLWGVVHTINAFMSRLHDQAEEAHFVITGSGNGAFIVYPDQPVYTATKAAVQAVTEALYLQTAAQNSPVKVHALFPGPYIVDTGIFDSDRVRPDRFAKSADAPDSGIHSADDMRQMMEDYGMELKTTHPDEVAQMALEGIREDKFWIMSLNPGSESQIKARMDSILHRQNPPIPSLG